jgi:hypothetical protein
MNTDQATRLLGSLLRSQRVFQSYDLSKEAKQRIIALQKLLEEYQAYVALPESMEAHAKLKQAFGLLQAAPPSGHPSGWEYAVLTSSDKADPAAEAEAWRAFLAEFLEK